MTHDEYIVLWKALKKKKKARLITEDEYAALGGKLDKAYQDKKMAQDIAKEIGCDPGTLATDESVLKLGKELKKVYGEASKEIQAELDAYLKKFGPEIHDLEAKTIDGTITEDEMKHLKLMTLQKNILNQKADQLSGMMLNANKKAMGMINGEQLHVFAENANWQSYQLTQDTKMNLMFSVYDEHTAAKLLKDKPELLPRKEVKGQKDKAWNRKIIAGAVLQGVIQGDSIPKLAKRIAVQTGETNMKAMTRYARTAMTSAQNSGRQEMLQKAKGMGIKCKKVWLATLDSRTRDAHGRLDGQKVDVDDDFQSDFGPIKFPGDLSSKGSVPANIYNCRCTLVYDYEGFPNDPTADQRISYDEYYTEETDADGKKHKVLHRESKLITDMSYDEWKTAKAEPPAQTDAYGAVGGKAWGVYKGEIPEDIRAKIDVALTAGKGTRTLNEYWRDLVDGKEQNAEIEALMRQIGQGPQLKDGGVNLSEDTIKAIDGYIEGTGNKFTDKQIKEIKAAMEKTDKPLYRVEDAQWMADGLKVGDEFTFDKPLKGFTQDMDGIRTVVAEGDDAGLYEETLVIFKTEGGTEAMDISGISRNHAEEKESLVGGKFEVVSVEDGPEINGHKTRIIKIRQIDAEEDARI